MFCMTKTVLKVSKLNKYFGSNQTLHNISFTCQEGEVVGLVGANGAGKTTIMKSILGLTSSNGTIFVNNKQTTFDHHEALKSVGALIEYPSMYPFMTGRDQLLLFARGNKKEKDKLVSGIVSELNMSIFIDKLTKGYSLGMKQKIGIALALLNNPSLVILDEPMNGLDPKSNKELRTIIEKRKAKGTTFLISSHILGDLQKIADKLIVVDAGHIVKKTTVSDILTSGRHIIVLITNKNKAAKDILKENGYDILDSDDNSVKVSVGSEYNLSTITKILERDGVDIINLNHEDNDLEDSVLTLLNMSNK